MARISNEQKRIQSEFDKCSTLSEIILKSTELKQKGENPAIVNKCLMIARKNLTDSKVEINRIPRVYFNTKELQLVSTIGFTVKDLYGSVISVSGDTITL